MEPLKCLISFILQTLEIDSAWSNIAILIVENNDGTAMENSSYPNQVFCLKCYPSLYNFTRGKLNANRTQLVILEDIPTVDSCDPESFKDVDITDKVIIILFSSKLSSKFAQFLNNVECMSQNYIQILVCLPEHICIKKYFDCREKLLSGR